MSIEPFDDFEVFVRFNALGGDFGWGEGGGGGSHRRIWAWLGCLFKHGGTRRFHGGSRRGLLVIDEGYLFIWIEVDDFVADAFFAVGLDAIDRHNFMAVGGGE